MIFKYLYILFISIIISMYCLVHFKLLGHYEDINDNSDEFNFADYLWQVLGIGLFCLIITIIICWILWFLLKLSIIESASLKSIIY